MRYIIRSVAAELAERTDSVGSRPTVKCCHMDRAVAHADLVTRSNHRYPTQAARDNGAR